MASIIGLANQQRALKDIQMYLNKITTINEFLSNLESYSGPFEILYRKEEKILIPDEVEQTEDSVSQDEEYDLSMEGSEDSAGVFASNSDVHQAEPNFKTVKKTYKAPFIVQDLSIIKNQIMQSKHHYVEKIENLCNNYNISLDASDEKIIHMFDHI